MSMDRCADCGRLVDTDDDPEAYVEILNWDDAVGFTRDKGAEFRCMCEPCRDKMHGGKPGDFNDLT